MNEEELVEALDRLEADRGAWAPHVRHDPQQRIFTRMSLSDELECWLICWMPGHDTGFHDHDLSSGVVRVLDGAVREQRLTLHGESEGQVLGAGEAFAFGPSDIHRVTHAGDVPTVTLHAYSPPLRRMGAYVVQESGTLARHPLAPGEELRHRAAV